MDTVAQETGCSRVVVSLAPGANAQAWHLPCNWVRRPFGIESGHRDCNDEVQLASPGREKGPLDKRKSTHWDEYVQDLQWNVSKFWGRALNIGIPTSQRSNTCSRDRH